MATPAKTTARRGTRQGSTAATAPASPEKVAPEKAEPVKAEPTKAEPAKKASAAATSRNVPSHSGRTDGVALDTYTMPDGYHMRWAHGSYDLLKLVDPAHVGDLSKVIVRKDEDGNVLDGTPPKWIVTCNAHGTMTTAPNAKEGDKIGSREGLPTWCPQHTAAPAKAEPQKAEPTKAAPAKAQAPKPGPTKKAAPAKGTAA